MNRRVPMLTGLAVVFCAASFLSVAPTSADIIQDTIFELTAEIPEVAQASFEVPYSAGTIDGDTLTWELTEPVPLIDGEIQIGTLIEASVEYVADPIVRVDYLVDVGALGANFTVTSAALVNLNIPNAIGRASAAITVTDIGGDGAALGGNWPTGVAYRSFYDAGNVAAGTGSTFADLVPGISGGGSLVSAQNFPIDGLSFSSVAQDVVTPLGTVNSMSAEWQFSVSANDSSSGTSFYEIIPEPGSGLLCLFGMIGLALVRRR